MVHTFKRQHVWPHAFSHKLVPKTRWSNIHSLGVFDSSNCQPLQGSSGVFWPIGRKGAAHEPEIAHIAPSNTQVCQIFWWRFPQEKPNAPLTQRQAKQDSTADHPKLEAKEFHNPNLQGLVLWRQNAPQHQFVSGSAYQAEVAALFVVPKSIFPDQKRSRSCSSSRAPSSSCWASCPRFRIVHDARCWELQR